MLAFHEAGRERSESETYRFPSSWTQTHNCHQFQLDSQFFFGEFRLSFFLLPIGSKRGKINSESDQCLPIISTFFPN